MEQGLGDDVYVKRVGEVVWIDGWIDGSVGGGNVDGSARERMFEAGEKGEVISRIIFRGRVEEGARIGYEFRDDTAGEDDLLSCGLGGVEELSEEEGVLFCEGSMRVRCKSGSAYMLRDWTCGIVNVMLR